MIKKFVHKPVFGEPIPDLRPTDVELPNGTIETTFVEFDPTSLNFGTFDDWKPSSLLEAGITPPVINIASSTRSEALEHGRGMIVAINAELNSNVEPVNQ